MSQAWRETGANPASQHQSGQRARRRLEQARERIAEQLDLRLAPPSVEDRILFTSGGTESNNLVLFGHRAAHDKQIVVSSIEHPSILRGAEALERQGAVVRRCRVTSDGVVDVDHLAELLEQPTRFVSVMLANNETGVLQPLEAIALRCREQGVPLHSDASQAVGKIRVSFQQLGVDAMTFTPHKFYGPIGIGGLVIGPHWPFEPILFGGFQQLGRRPGTESMALASGAAKALELALNRLDADEVRLRSMRDRFEAALRDALPNLIIHGGSSPRLPHVSCLAFPNVDGQALFVALDQVGIECSTGSACASGSAEVSPVLLAMGLPEHLARSSLRFSFGRFNDDQDWQIAADRIIRCVNNLQR